MEIDFGRVAGIAHYLDAVMESIRCYPSPSRRNTFIDLAVSCGFTVIGRGSFRVSVVHPTIPGVVFKVETAQHCNYMAEQEFEFYTKEATVVDLQVLAVCYYATDSVCVMELVEGVKASLQDWETEDWAVLEFDRIIGRKFIPNYVDAGSQNIMIKPDGTLCLFDYTRVD